MKEHCVTHLSNFIIPSLIFHIITTIPLGSLMATNGDSTNLPFVLSNMIVKIALSVVFDIAPTIPPCCSLNICWISSLLIVLAIAVRSFSLAVLFSFLMMSDRFLYSLRIALMSNVNIIWIVFKFVVYVLYIVWYSPLNGSFPMCHDVWHYRGMVILPTDFHRFMERVGFIPLWYCPIVGSYPLIVRFSLHRYYTPIVV